MYYYEGEFKHGHMHGSGKLVWEGEKVLECMWEAGKRKGPEGKLTTSNGDVYDGEISTDYLKHGAGVLRFATGDVYHGCFENDLISGIGKKVYSDGDYYEGEWQAGKFYRWNV